MIAFLPVLAVLAAHADEPARDGEKAPVALPRRIGFGGSAGVSSYANDDHLTVVSPWISVDQEVWGPVRVDAGYRADIISTASVDIVSSATQPFREERHQGNGGVAVDLKTKRFSATYTGSTESDTHAHTVTGGAEIDLFDRNLTLGTNYGLVLQKTGTVDAPPELWGNRTLQQVDLVATQILTPSTLVSLNYTLQHAKGDLANPYQQVPLFPTDSEESGFTRDQAQWVYERFPDTRWRHALAVLGRQALSERVFLKASYRGYFDTWSMRANTGETGAAFDLHRAVVEIDDRFHWQSRVSFTRDAFTVNRAYLTVDRRFGEMMTNITGLAVRPVLEPVRFVVRGELHWTRYVDRPALLPDALVPIPDVWGGLGQVGVAWSI